MTNPLTIVSDLGVLRGLSLFSALPEEGLQQLWKSIDKVTYPKGAVIFSEDQQCRHLHVLISGAVKIYKLSEEGHEQLIHLMKPVSFFGEDIVFGGDRYEAGAQTLMETTLYNIERRALESLVLGYPPFALSLLVNFGRRLKRMMMLVGEAALQDVRKRLCRALLELAEEQGPGNSATPVIEMRHADLAAYIGAARETLSRALGRLEQDGLIARRNHQIILRNLPGLLREVPHWREDHQLFPPNPDRFAKA